MGIDMIDYTFETPHPIVLTIKNLGGKVAIHATDTSVTRVSLEGARAEETAVTQQGGEISVIAPNVGWLDSMIVRHVLRINRTDITVEVPSGSDLTLRLGGGNINVTGRLGRIELSPGAGDIHLSEIAGETSVHLGAGNIAIDAINAPTQVVSGAGNITVGQVSGATSLQLATGDVTIGRVAAPVTVKSSVGGLKVDEVTSDLDIRTSFGDTKIKRMISGSLEYKGSAGDVKVGVPAGTPTWTDLSCRAGTIRNSLPPVGQPRPGQDHVEIRITSTSGVIELKPSPV